MPIFVLHGPNQLAIEDECLRIKKEFFRRHPQGLYFAFLASDEALDETKIRAAFLAAGLFSEEARFILLKHFLAEEGAPYGEVLSSLLADLSPATLVVFWEGAATPPSELKSFLEFQAQEGKALFRHYALPRSRELNAWIRHETQKAGGTIDERAAERLAVFAGRDLSVRKKDKNGRYFEEPLFDLGRLRQEIRKLVGFRGQEAIQEKDVEVLVQPQESQAIFELIDAVVGGDGQKALAIIQGLAGDWERLSDEAAFYIIHQIATAVRSLLLARRALELFGHQAREKLREGLTDSWTTGKMNLVLRKAQNVSFERLRALHHQLFLIDQRLKGESSLSPGVILTEGLAAMTEEGVRE